SGPSSRSSRTTRSSESGFSRCSRRSGSVLPPLKELPLLQQTMVSMPDVDAVNSGYARVLLEEYLENPEAVPSEWRALFESGDGDLIEALPGLARLLENLRETNGHAAPAPTPEAAPTPEPAAAPPDDDLLGGVAAAMSLVKALRTHGHLAARLDPLGSEPVGDPALEPERLQPRLTPELQARIPASLLRVHTPGGTLPEVLPKLQETDSSTS